MQFKINGIVSEEAKFNYLVSQLEPKYVEDIWDMVTSNSATKYLESKTMLMLIRIKTYYRNWFRKLKAKSITTKIEIPGTVSY